MKTLKDDLESAPNNIDRLWIRIPITIFLSLIAIPVWAVLGALLGAYEMFRDFTIPCLLGEKTREFNGY